MNDETETGVEVYDTSVEFADGVVILTAAQFAQIKEYLWILAYYIETEKDRELADLAAFTDSLDGETLEDLG